MTEAGQTLQTLVREGKLNEADGFRSLFYHLEEESLFRLSDYRVMRGVEQKGLCRCIRTLHNGTSRFVYMTGDLKPMDRLYGFMDLYTFLVLAANSMDVVCEVEENGFLHIQNLDLSPGRILVDPETLDVKMVYVPILTENVDAQEVNEAFCVQLQAIIKTVPVFASPEAAEACAILAERRPLREKAVKLREISSRFGGVRGVRLEEIADDETRQLAANIRLEAEAPDTYSFHIHEASFVIGKHTKGADGVIPKSSVSRQHCGISFDGRHYYVEDLDSTNGTFLNGVRLPSHQKKELQDGDLLRVADVHFRVEI